MGIRSIVIGMLFCLLFTGCAVFESEWHKPVYMKNAVENNEEETIKIAGELALAKKGTIVVAKNGKVGVVTSNVHPSSEYVYISWRLPSSTESQFTQKLIAKYIGYTVTYGSQEYDELSGLFLAGMDQKNN